MTKFAIVITTYQRPDGKTPEKLTRALNSVNAQRHTDWKVFLMGDRYEDDEEFNRLASLIPKDKITAINRPEAAERDNYPAGSMQLWCAGGNVSSRAGIDLALSEGYEYVCYLDHDDYWHDAHLLHFNNALEEHPDLVILASRSLYLSEANVLPPPSDPGGYGYIPIRERVIKSATCIKWTCTNIRARDVYKETGQVKPGDLDLWERFGEEMKEKNMKGFLVDYVTCSHLDERYTLRSGDKDV